MKSIRIQMAILGLKQQQIAQEAGVHRSYISNVIAGRVPPTERIVRAFRAYGIEIRDTAK